METIDSEFRLKVQEYIQPEVERAQRQAAPHLSILPPVSRRLRNYQNSVAAPTYPFELLRGGSTKASPAGLQLVELDASAPVSTAPLRPTSLRRPEVAVNTYDLYHA